MITVALGTVPKGLFRGLEELEIVGRADFIQTTALLKSARILRRVPETCYHSDSSERPSANACMKISQGIIIIMIITRKQKWEEKQFVGRFKRLISNISHEKTWAWLRKGNLKRETESLLIAAENNAIRTNNIKAKVGKTQQNSRCRLCSDRDETINYIISVCSKLAQKEYKTRHDWMSKVIHWELCKKLKFDHTNKWYMHNPIAFQENDTHELLWDFDIQTDHLISTRPYNNYKKRENFQNCVLCCPDWPLSKIERKWKER